MTRDALFFGTFNPIHQGHLAMAHQTLQQGGFDRVVFIPAAVPPHRQTDRDMAAFEDRLAMVQLACQTEPRFVASDIEAHLPYPSFTCDTLRHLYPTASPQNRVDVIIGADALAGLASWKDPFWLASCVTFWQAPRTGWPETTAVVVQQHAVPIHSIILDMAPVTVSATEVRHDLTSSKDVWDRVPESVQQYCQTHHLYSRAPRPYSSTLA